MIFTRGAEEWGRKEVMSRYNEFHIPLSARATRVGSVSSGWAPTNQVAVDATPLTAPGV